MMYLYRKIDSPTLSATLKSNIPRHFMRECIYVCSDNMNQNIEIV